MLSVIVPARDEAACIGACLAALDAQDLDPAATGGAEIVVVANGCADGTAALARLWTARLAARGLDLRVIETARAGKAAALDLGDAAASGNRRVFLDADVVASPPLLAQIAAALAVPEPRFVSGTLVLAPPGSRATRMFARVWTRLPFFAETAPAAGLYAVNAAGRGRWGAFPDLIADDCFVRAHFATAERVQVPAGYVWPLAEGALRLLRARRRQEAGLRQLARLRPDLRTAPERPHDLGRLARIALADPAGAAVYVGVTGLAKLTVDPSDRTWHRGR